MSAIPAAQDGLAALLAADATVGPYFLGIGWPVPDPPLSDAVWIDGHISDRKSTDLTTGLGERSEEETFTVRVQVHCSRATALFTDVRTVLMAYLLAIEEAIEVDRTLAVAPNFDCTSAAGDIHDFLLAPGAGRGAACHVDIFCTALT